MSSQLEYSRGERIADRYEVVDLLGDGPLALSYRAKDTVEDRFVRVLLIRPEVAGPDSPELAAAFAEAVSHPHEGLLEVTELGEADGVALVVLEDFDAPTLRDVLSEHKLEQKDFDVRFAAQVVTGVLEALRQLHGTGHVFRALRPEYILVKTRRTGPRKQGRLTTVKLIGAFLWDLVPTTALVEDEFTRGEAQYLAPELKAVEPKASARSDLYSCGVMLYEMLVGTAPVGTFQLPRARRPDLPSHLNTVTELALALAPGDRYTSADAFIKDVQRTFETAGNDVETRRPMVAPIGFALALVFVVLVALIAWAMRSDPAKEAAARDSQIRAEVIEAHDKPGEAEIRSVQSRHPQNMIYIPAGPYVRGRLHHESSKVAPSSEPLAEVVEVDAFLIDAFESPNLKGGDPTTKINYRDAEAACEAEGKRLCSADEWEKACKGPRNTVYSWGDEFSESACGMGLDDIHPSGEAADCRSGWGVFDLSGNYIEWTATAPKGKDSRRIVKGGLKGNHAKGARCSHGTDASVAYKDITLSFRCCRDVDAPPVEQKPAEE